MNERKEISLNNSIMDIMVLMAEGNPGGLSVIASLVKDNPDGIVYLLHLDDMNIRGTQIWIGFKDYCGQSMTKFVECVVSRDQGMIDKINEVNQAQGEPWMATKGQASSGQRLKF